MTKTTEAPTYDLPSDTPLAPEAWILIDRQPHETIVRMEHWKFEFWKCLSSNGRWDAIRGCPYTPGYVLPVRERWRPIRTTDMGYFIEYADGRRSQKDQRVRDLWLRAAMADDYELQPASTMPDWAIRIRPKIRRVRALQPKDAIVADILGSAVFHQLRANTDVVDNMWFWVLTLDIGEKP